MSRPVCPVCDARPRVADGKLGPHDRRHHTPLRVRDFNRYQRAETIWQQYRQGGVTYEEIATGLGITREYVRQILVTHVGHGVMRLVQDRERRRARHRQWVETADWRQWPSCFICGGPVAGGRDTRWATCLAHSANRLGATIRMSVDPARHDSHRHSQAKVPTTVERYAAVGKGTYDPDKPANRRYVQRGSLTDQVFTEALNKGWPLAELIPPEIRAKYRLGENGWELSVRSNYRVP